MNDASHSSRASTGRTSTFLLLGIVLLPVLYVLSLGPMIMLENRGWLGPDDGPLYRSIALFYLPLALCLQAEIPGLSPALEWYVNLWAA